MVTGSYTNSEDASDTYSSQETGVGDRNFTLTVSGTNTYTDGETGNRVTGDYTRLKTGTDSYTMQEDGTKAGGTHSEAVTANESYTLTDTGNLGTGTYARTVDGDGSYDRTVTGDGATEPSDTGAIDYLFAQSADPHSGTFDASWTGTTRYDLLEDFHDISNTQPGRSPGHMNFYPFGQPFVDPVHPDEHAGAQPRTTPAPIPYRPWDQLTNPPAMRFIPQQHHPALGGVTLEELEMRRRLLLKSELTNDAFDIIRQIWGFGPGTSQSGRPYIPPRQGLFGGARAGRP